MRENLFLENMRLITTKLLLDFLTDIRYNISVKK